MSVIRRIAAVIILVFVGCGPDARSGSESAVATNIAAQSAAQPDAFKYDAQVVMGLGQNDCGKMTADLRADPTQLPTGITPRAVVGAMYTHYAEGFITGANFRSLQTRQGSPNVGESISPEALLAAIEQYCEQHPLNKVLNAVAVVYVQLAAR